MSYNESRLSNSNYPEMSQTDWDNAPWNQVDPEPKDYEYEYEVKVGFQTTISSTDYDYNEDYEGDAVQDFNAQHYSITSLMDELVKRLKAEITALPNRSREKYKLQDLLKDAEMYSLADIEVEQL